MLTVITSNNWPPELKLNWGFWQARESELNLKPSYQREFVWDKQAILNNLIETALRDLPIPEIWLHEQNTIGPKGRTKLVADVVDGKQRLTTLLGFLNNDNPLKSKAAPDSNEFRLQVCGVGQHWGSSVFLWTMVSIRFKLKGSIRIIVPYPVRIFDFWHDCSEAYHWSKFI